jgi:uncharacterized membrane protein
MEESGKKLLKSKTFWVNLLALVVIVAQTFTGFVVSVEIQASILAIINVILRVVTKEEIIW